MCDRMIAVGVLGAESLGEGVAEDPAHRIDKCRYECDGAGAGARGRPPPFSTKKSRLFRRF